MRALISLRAFCVLSKCFADISSYRVKGGYWGLTPITPHSPHYFDDTDKAIEAVFIAVLLVFRIQRT